MLDVENDKETIVSPAGACYPGAPIVNKEV